MSTAISTLIEEKNVVTVDALVESCGVPVQAAKPKKTVCRGAANKLGCNAEHIFKS